jgi:16S rRNA (adenine1518-N6/adenine1519-N6)-dimethyltransferase
MGLRAKTRMVLELAERDFDPPPRVACAVVHVVPKPPDAALDGPTLEAVLEAAWSARRRTLRHALAPVAAPLGVAPQAVTDALSAVSAAGRTAGEVAAWEYAVIAKTLAAARPANR